MPKITIPQEDGDDITVDASEAQLPDGYQLMQEDTLKSDYVRKDYHEKEIERVSKRFEGSAREELKGELKNDESFIESVLEEHASADERVQELQAKNKQLQDKLDDREEKLEAYGQRTKRAAILEDAREMNVDERFTKAVGEADPYIATVLDGRVEEVEPGTYVALDEDGNRMPAPEGTDRTYARPKDLLAQWRETGDNEHLFAEPEKNNGSGYSGSNGQAAPSTSKSEMSTSEKVDFIKEHGREAYDNLD